MKARSRNKNELPKIKFCLSLRLTSGMHHVDAKVGE